MREATLGDRCRLARPNKKGRSLRGIALQCSFRMFVRSVLPSYHFADMRGLPISKMDWVFKSVKSSGNA